MEKPRSYLNQMRTTSNETPEEMFLLVPVPVQFQGEVRFDQLPETPLGKVNFSSTEPSVLNQTKILFDNSAPVLVTTFLDGQEGQTIFVVGDGQTTLDNGTSIFTNTGADKLLLNGEVYCFTLVNGEWRELASGSVAFPDPPPATIALISFGSLHTHAGFTGYETYANTLDEVRGIADLADRTEFRVIYALRQVTTFSATLRIEYSLNGSSWSTFWTSAAFSGTATVLTSYAAIPAGAINATVYLRALVQMTTGETVRITSLQLQVK